MKTWLSSSPAKQLDLADVVKAARSGWLALAALLLAHLPAWIAGIDFGDGGVVVAPLLVFVLDAVRRFLTDYRDTPAEVQDEQPLGPREIQMPP